MAWRSEIVSLLPFAYALTGTLYFVLLLKNLYPDYTIGKSATPASTTLFDYLGDFVHFVLDTCHRTETNIEYAS